MDSETQRVLLIGSIQAMDVLSQEIKDGLIASINRFGNLVRKEERRNLQRSVEDVFDRA